MKIAAPPGWEVVSKWCIRRGDYTITKTGPRWDLRYTPWHGKDILSKATRDLAEAMAEVEAHSLGNSGQSRSSSTG